MDEERKENIPEAEASAEQENEAEQEAAAEQDASAEPDNSAGDDPEAKKPKPDIFAQLFDFFDMLCVALTIVILMFSFIGRHSPVNGTSMYPTLDEGDLMIVTSLPYTPKRGDIVVFQNPGLYERPFIKRVIAVEGDTLDIDFDTWSVYVNGEKLDESYINYEAGTTMRGKGGFEFPMTLPEGYCWCMGDNRNNSTDSRVIGPIDNRFILGQAVCRIWPLGK